jgi:hypothetical protein
MSIEAGGLVDRAVRIHGVAQLSLYIFAIASQSKKWRPPQPSAYSVSADTDNDKGRNDREDRYI